MSSWAALNVEPDETVEEEIDDTKEIQVEEALKLYQNALKLHSLGSQFYTQASEAYDALLKSDLFLSSPESPFSDALRTTELRQPKAAVDQDEAYSEAVDINDSTSSSLFQTIFLSYKNYGQFLLDSLQDLLKNTPHAEQLNAEVSAKVAARSSLALSSFADALERDDTDLDLWRKSARLSSALQSYRLARYCLESVLADDDNRLEVRTQQLGLEETCAEESLREILLSFYDRLWSCQVPMKKPKKALLKFFKRHIDPYPYLPALPPRLENTGGPSESMSALKPDRSYLHPEVSSWLSVGEVLLDAVNSGNYIDPGTAFGIALPPGSPQAGPPLAEQAMPEEEKFKAKNVEKQEVPEEQLDTAVSAIDAVSESNNTAGEVVVKAETPARILDDQSLFDREVESQQDETPETTTAGQRENTRPVEQLSGQRPPSLGVNRKRSSTSVANDELAEGGRMKSRRTRAREANAETLRQDDVVFDQNKYFEDRLQPYIQADDLMFTTVGSLLSRIGVEGFGCIGQLRRQAFEPNEMKGDTEIGQVDQAETLLIQDLRSVVNNWNERLAQFVRERDPLSTFQDANGMNKLGLAIFLEHFKSLGPKNRADMPLTRDDGLCEFVSAVDDSWLGLNELSFKWLQRLLGPKYKDEPVQSTSIDMYKSTLWPDELKRVVVRLLVKLDEYIYKRVAELVTVLDRRILDSVFGAPFEYGSKQIAELEMIQTIFELHLDFYAQMDDPNSEVDQEARILQRDRLERWSMLARTSLIHFLDRGLAGGEFRLSVVLRHIWASTLLSGMTAGVSRELILAYLEDMKSVLRSLGEPVIHLVNNTCMSEISVAAVDREVSKLKSMGFFMRIFDPSFKDPVDIIESIEPIVEPLAVEYVDEDRSAFFQEMVSFLDRGDPTLRLFLWRKLHDAYKAIDYTPKVISCSLRSIEVIVDELWRLSRLGDKSLEERQTELLRWLKQVDAYLTSAVTLVFQDLDKAYESVDNDHAKSSLAAVSRLLTLLHSFVLYEDSVRVGRESAPELRNTLSKSQEAFKERLREMQVNCWILHYTLLKEAMSQNRDLFGRTCEERIRYLSLVHGALGSRSMCKYSNKRFLKLTKAELFGLGAGKEHNLEICQVLFDLYGLKFSSSDNVSNHGCPSEKLDRSTAVMMIDFVMPYAKGMNIRDLPKSELKPTIDKMQVAIGVRKASPPVTFNRRVLNAFLKAPLDPSYLFHAVQGLGELTMVAVPGESADIARKGWCFLLGCLALTKFRSQKRLSPVPTTDLDDAIAYFRQDLENAAGGWESWYRLAQAYDSKLDEDLTWSAEKINGTQTELVNWQRCAIRCYAMAVATAIRTMEPTPENKSLLSDLYTDFAIRMYMSSREPLSMKAFGLGDTFRFFNKEGSQETYKKRPFQEMKPYAVWKFASYLLRRALVIKPNRWM